MAMVIAYGTVAIADIEGRPAALEQEAPHPAAGTTMMPVTSPESEVLQPERGVLVPSAPLPLEQPIDPDKYICGRGDTFDMNFWGRQNLKARVTVDPEGRTFIPKVGYVDVVGKTLTVARQTIRRAVLRFYPGLNFDVSLQTPRTFLVHVVDHVKKPGVYPATPLDRVASVLDRAGGIIGSRRRIEIHRRDGSKTAADLVAYEQTGDTKYNPVVSDGDVIDVPAEGIAATISGSVNRPGRFELVGTKDLDELIRLAGGLRSTFTRKLPIEIVRRNSKTELAERIALPVSVGRPYENAPLQADDQVRVPSSTEMQRTLVLVGAIAGADPTDEATAIKRVPFVENDTVRLLIERNGGLSSSADLFGGYIRRESGELVPLDLEALLVRRDFSADRPVQLGDTVVIPYKRRAVVVEGSVLHASALPFNPRFHVSEYIASAGGATRVAQQPGSYRVVRTDGKVLQNRPDLVVQPGDTIIVPERSFSRTEIVQLVLGTAGILLSAATLVFLAVRTP